MSINLTAIAFRIINFTLFFYCAYYIFKKYARRSIEDEIAQEEVIKEKLIAEHASLEETIKDLKNEHVSLAATIKDLSLKADMWSTRTAQANRRMISENQRSLEQLVEKNKTQQVIYKEYMLRNAALEGALNKVEERIRQSTDSKNASRELQTIIDRLAR